MNTAMASYNTTVRQVTEIFQWRKCLSEKKYNKRPTHQRRYFTLWGHATFLSVLSSCFCRLGFDL